MNTVRQIFFVDAWFSYEPDLYTKEYYSYKEDLRVKTTSVHAFSAYGFVEKHGSDIVIAFIKKKGVSLKEAIEKRDSIVDGLVIPEVSLSSKANSCNHHVLSGVEVGARIAVTWRDPTDIRRLAEYDCSVMYTEGTLYKIQDNHIVLRDTETIRVHPMPVVNHPAGRPLWYIIPIAFIKDIEVISKKS